MFRKRFNQNTTAVPERELRCSFCNKSAADVRKLLAGPAVFICDECVSACVDILARDKKADEDAAAEAAVKTEREHP